MTAQDITDTTPVGLAKHLLDACRHKSGALTLRRFAQDWWTYTGSRWEIEDDERVRARVYHHFEANGMPMKSRKVTEIIDAVSAYSQTEPGDMPRWLDSPDRWPDPDHVVCFLDGWIDLGDFDPRQPVLRPHTPNLFSTFRCPFEYDPGAQCPRWDEFLQQVFSNDQDSIDLLHEWFGVCMTANLEHEKLMLLEGRSRSGKGTSLEVLTALLGQDQCCSTSIQSIGSDFGLQPLIGKYAAILPDAHITRGSDVDRAVEVIKSVSGRDRQSINRKNQKHLPSVLLRTRITLAVNEIPRLPDAAGALKPRLLILHYPNSYEGHEDTTLKSVLVGEVQGIANRALEGVLRVTRNGRFTLPARSAEVLAKFERLTNPVKAFVEDECETDPAAWVRKKDLYDRYTVWCKGCGEPRISVGVLSNRMEMLGKGITTCKRGPKGAQFPAYNGVRLIAEDAKTNGQYHDENDDHEDPLC